MANRFSIIKNGVVKAIGLAILFLPWVQALAFSVENSPAFWGQEITLKGYLKSEQKYGPPGYGETPAVDVLKVVPRIVLFHAISVASNTTGIDIHIRQAQLVNFNQSDHAELNISTCVKVKGELFEAQSGHHYYDAVIDVTNVSECD